MAYTQSYGLQQEAEWVQCLSRGWEAKALFLEGASLDNSTIQWLMLAYNYIQMSGFNLQVSNLFPIAIHRESYCLPVNTDKCSQREDQRRQKTTERQPSQQIRIDRLNYNGEKWKFQALVRAKFKEVRAKGIWQRGR